MTKKLSLVVLLLLVILSFQFISASELKLVKVSELKPGDTIVDKNGNEIVIQTIQAQPIETKSLTQLINEKVFSNQNENKTSYLTGFAIQTKDTLAAAQPKIVEKIKSFFTGWFK